MKRYEGSLTLTYLLRSEKLSGTSVSYTWQFFLRTCIHDY